MTKASSSAVWKALEGQRKSLARVPLMELFAQDPDRFPRLSVEAAGLLLDYSKNRITGRTISLLFDLAEEAELSVWIERLFAGAPVDGTQRRPALHMALRAATTESVMLNGQDIMPAIEAERAKVAAFAADVREGRRRGHDGRAFETIVAIGIGGSQLGPALAVEALSKPGNRPVLRFVANVDGAEIEAALAGLQPATTLFLIISKSFTTAETIVNAEAARAWFTGQGGPAVAIPGHFVAVSANPDAVANFGLDPQQGFAFWDWVSGRFSLWSAVGLPVALAAGPEAFAELLAGAAAMDAHFREAPLRANMPVLLGLVGIWNRNFLSAESLAVLPYDQRLAQLPAFLQQLEMESNGKRVNRDGELLDHGTVPAIWGGVGTNAQHAFFQALHQGPGVIPADFVLARRGIGDPVQHRILLANCLAQSEALMRGRDLAAAKAELESRGLASEDVQRLAPHLVCPGDRPSNTILLERLDARGLGALLALYEHKVFVQGVLWGINSFDQWGVRLGKRLAATILDELSGGQGQNHDASTAGLIARCR